MGVNSLPKTVTRQRRDCDQPRQLHFLAASRNRFINRYSETDKYQCQMLC